MQHFDFIIIGSGFGGSISAMRLAQKGYSVALLEKGKRWKDTDFPKSNWELKKFLWLPLFKCFGIQDITILKGVMVLHGAGVGGGSLVYANTLMTPKENVFQDPSWPKGVNWFEDLKPHYLTAKKMLGVTTNPKFFEGELALKKLSQKMNAAETFHATEVGVFFGEPEKIVSDPYFKGNGPERTGCNFCGACMIGCRNNAKNTLEKNYLYFAQKHGAQIFAETVVSKIIPLAPTPESAHKNKVPRYIVETKCSTKYFSKTTQLKAAHVIVSAGALGTLNLLFKNRDAYKTLPNISSQLGSCVRTNGESLTGVTSFKEGVDFSKGIAIGAAFHPDTKTKIEAVRYPARSDVMKWLAAPLTENGTMMTRPIKLFFNTLLHLKKVIQIYTSRSWAQQTLILLIMQTTESKMNLHLKKTWIGKSFLKRSSQDEMVPSFIPEAQNATKILAEEYQGLAQNSLSEVLLATPTTAHILGGCIMGKTPQEGVIHTNHEVFGYPGLYVCDGSVIAANLGVNPSLTISALSERFVSQFPELDGKAYEI